MAQPSDRAAAAAGDVDGHRLDVPVVMSSTTL
jgi:hypothetical protein